MKKSNLSWLFWTVVIVALVGSLQIIFAQPTNDVRAVLAPGVPNLPQGKEAIWLALVAPITFTVTWLIGKIPPLPKEVLPWLTPVVGILLGVVMKKATDSHWAWWSSAAFGMISTTIYEGIKGITGAGPDHPLTPTPKPGS